LIYRPIETENARENSGLARSDEENSIVGMYHVSSPIIQKNCAIAPINRESTMQFELCQSVRFKIAAYRQSLNFACYVSFCGWQFQAAKV
jgi:hypothetical protein